MDRNADKLQGLVAEYRRLVVGLRSGTENPYELEIRFLNVDFPIFKSLLDEYCLSPTSGASPRVSQAQRNSGAASRTARATPRGQISQVINAIAYMRERLPTTPQSIRQIRFKDGKREGEEYLQKKQVMLPVYTENHFVMDYRIALSLEGPGTEFISDNRTLIRVKLRASFDNVPLEGWRTDMTVVRELEGSNPALKEIVNRMFQPGMTPENMLEKLGLREDAGDQQQYKYEVEIEYIGDLAAAADITAEEIRAAADKVLSLTNPNYLTEAAYQNEIFYIAGQVLDNPQEIANYRSKWGIKNLTPQVTTLSRVEYQKIYPPMGFFVTEKTDGVRALAVVRNNRCVVLAKTIHEWEISRAKATDQIAELLEEFSSTEASETDELTIVDAEVVLEFGGGSRRPNSIRLYIFDVVYLKGERLVGGFEERVTRIPDAVKVFAHFEGLTDVRDEEGQLGSRVTTRAGEPAGDLARPARGSLVALGKNFSHITDTAPAAMKKVFEGVLNRKRKPGEPAIDGLIMTKPGAPWLKTVNYKWKSEEDTTIDMLIRKAPEGVEVPRSVTQRAGQSAGQTYFLFVGVSQQMYRDLGMRRCPGYSKLFATEKDAYFPIQFETSDSPYLYIWKPVTRPNLELDGLVGEFRWEREGEDVHPGHWTLVRIRDDRQREVALGRYFGNDYRFAEMNWLNYLDPFPAAELWDGPSSYFRATKSSIYRAQTAFTSFVKEEQIAQIGAVPLAIDLAAGKGQDIGRYFRAGVKHLVAVDVDRSALVELVRRKHTLARSARGQVRPDHGAIRISVVEADLTDPWADTLAKIKEVVPPNSSRGPNSGRNPNLGSGLPADACVMNLAVHYFCGRSTDLANLVVLMRELVAVGGTVSLTAMAGDRVNELLKGVPAGQEWRVMEGDVTKYAIRRAYAGTNLQAYGQKVGVLLPFSLGEYYEEYLVNIENLVSVFEKRGFKLERVTPFENYVSSFKTNRREHYMSLTEDDLKYLSLYSEITLKRV